jgi:hypothetical protein
MTAADHRGNIASLNARRERVWISSDEEVARIDRERANIIQTRDAELLEIDSALGDEIDALEAIEEAEESRVRLGPYGMYIEPRAASIAKWSALA